MQENINNESIVIDTIPDNFEEQSKNMSDELEAPKELSDEEKKAILIQQLKESRIRFHSITQNGNITTNQFGTAYKKKRQAKNKAASKSRKANR